MHQSFLNLSLNVSSLVKKKKKNLENQSPGEIKGSPEYNESILFGYLMPLGFRSNKCLQHDFDSFKYCLTIIDLIVYFGEGWNLLTPSLGILFIQVWLDNRSLSSLKRA